MNVISNREIDGTDSVFIIIDDFLDSEEQKIYDEHVRNIEDWKNGHFFGCEIQRLQKWYNDDDKYFSKHWANQSHDRWKSNKHEGWLLSLRDKVQRKINEVFDTIIIENDLSGCNRPVLNSSLLNYYRDGSDCIKYHSDDEKVFGSNPTVGMLAFGSQRYLQFKRIQYKTENEYQYVRNPAEDHLNKKFVIKPGSLFLMMGSVQKYYYHGIDKDLSVNDARYSITFRAHKN